MVKVKPVQNGRTSRMSFSRINEVIGMPNLIEIQKNSYNWFLDEGLQEVFWTSTPNIPLKNVKSVTQRMLRRFMSLRAC